MDLRRRKARRQSGDLRQQAPAAVGSLNWHVFEHLINIVLADDSRMPQMTDGQRFVFAVDYLRQEVNADGFEAYLDRAPASWQQPMIDSGDSVIPGLAALLAEAIGSRDVAADDFDSLDAHFYELEASVRMDEALDRYITANWAEFFVR